MGRVRYSAHSDDFDLSTMSFYFQVEKKKDLVGRGDIE